MASKIGLSYKLEEAEGRLKHEADRLRSRGVDIGSRPEKGRQAEVNSVNLVVWAGDVLEAANQRIDELMAEDRTREPSSEPNYTRMRVEELREELDERKIAIPDGAKKADLVALLEASDTGVSPVSPVEEPQIELPAEPVPEIRLPAEPIGEQP